MNLYRSTSTAARLALVYITTGALLLIWTGVWFVYLRNNPPDSTTVYYFCAGFAVTGLVLIIIGLGLGPLGQSARKADLPEVVARGVPPSAEPIVPAVVKTEAAAAPTNGAPVVKASPASVAASPKETFGQ